MNLSRFHDDLGLIAIVIIQNRLAETVLGFTGGENYNYRVLEIGALGGIDSDNVSSLYPEITVIENRLVVYEDYVIYQQPPPPFIELPVVLDFDLYFIAFSRNFSVYQEVWPLAVGRVTITLPPGTYNGIV